MMLDSCLHIWQHLHLNHLAVVRQMGMRHQMKMTTQITRVWYGHTTLLPKMMEKVIVKMRFQHLMFTPLVLLFAFLQGLRTDVAEHVRERIPKTVEEAQTLAITYEQIQRGNK